MSSTDQSLETYLEMDEKEVMTKQSVQKLHDEQMFSGNNHKQSESQIIHTLGGIDSILSVYLDEANDILLTNNQILRLYSLLKTPQTHQQKNKVTVSQKIIMNNQTNNEQQTAEFSYRFDVNDTILHSLFSATTAWKIKQFIDHKLVLMLGTIAAIIGWSLLFGFGQSLIFNIYIIAVFCLLGIPWMIFKHLSLNKKGFILCLKTFDFWIKTCYGMIGTITNIFNGATSHGHILMFVQECVFGIFAVLSISYIAAFDASNSSKTNKLIMSIVAAVVTSLLSIQILFFDPEENDYKIRIELTKSVISMQSMLAGACRIIAIFFWKQVISTLRKNGRAVSIRCSPQIIWTDCNVNQENVMKYEEKEDKIKRMETNLEEEKEEINTENALRKREEKRESISWSMHDEEMVKIQNELKESYKLNEENENEKND